MALDESITSRLKAEARRLGFSVAGVVDAAPSARLEHYLRWIEADYHGAMGYMARPDRVSRRQDLNVILPGVRSIVCVGLDYASLTATDALGDPARGRISNYAWGADYHDVMTPRLQALAAWLEGACAGPVAWRVYVDTGAILERDHAQAAGLGFVGKNTMLIQPQRGSWFFLGELLTTAALTPDAAASMPSCGRCQRCLAACPTDAFPRPYVLDARRCISYLTIELKGGIPPALRPAMGNWVYGCDICQAVCPFNRFAPETVEPALQTDALERMAPPLTTLLALDDEAFKMRFNDSPIKRIGRDRLVRNACVAAGNWGGATAVAPLTRLLADEAPLVRGHAAWALGRIGGATARAALSAAQAAEGNTTVREELAAALTAS